MADFSVFLDELMVNWSSFYSQKVDEQVLVSDDEGGIGVGG